MSALFQKTAAGQNEIRTRKLKLSPKLRTMLILIDGTVSVSALKEKAALIGAPEDSLEQLHRAGLIVDLSSASPRPRADAALHSRAS